MASDGYHDLQGWIEHEQETGGGRPPWTATHPQAARLTHLPFGGFEYTDRIYAIVEPGAEHGHIVAWKKGLPPAWTHALHEDSVSTIADQPARRLLRHCTSTKTPLAPAGDYFSGQTLLEYTSTTATRTMAWDLDLMDKAGRVLFPRHARLAARPLAEATLRHQPALAPRGAAPMPSATDDAALVRAARGGPG